jgi:hypothetical protein
MNRPATTNRAPEGRAVSLLDRVRNKSRHKASCRPNYHAPRWAAQQRTSGCWWLHGVVVGPGGGVKTAGLADPSGPS